jgi:4-amino-4-deoxy-L-arabinose transferase-like glycosyltransferase
LSRANLAALAAVALLGLALRVHDIAAAPPGLFYDEAANAIDALDLISGAPPRIFFPGNQGREPLHIYSIALASAALGPGWLAVRLPSILVGTATLLAAYLLGREVGGPRVGLASALLLSVSYWHISLSRMGFRAVWVPLVIAAALALTLRAQRTGRRWPAVLAGAAMGLGYYTYIAARIIPLTVVLGAAAGWRCRSWRRSLGPLALALAVAALVALPIGAYFWRHPELFWGRVETASGGPLGAGERIVNALGLFVWHGDDLARHNLPGRPLFDPLAGGLFLLGLAICLRRWREPGYAALPTACAVMLLPQALAWGEPHFLRAAGVLPAAQVTAAVGLDAVLARLAGGLRRPALAALAIFWAGLVARDYFVTWAPREAGRGTRRSRARGAPPSTCFARRRRASRSRPAAGCTPSARPSTSPSRASRRPSSTARTRSCCRPTAPR